MWTQSYNHGTHTEQYGLIIWLQLMIIVIVNTSADFSFLDWLFGLCQKMLKMSHHNFPKLKGNIFIISKVIRLLYRKRKTRKYCYCHNSTITKILQVFCWLDEVQYIYLVLCGTINYNLLVFHSLFYFIYSLLTHYLLTYLLRHMKHLLSLCSTFFSKNEDCECCPPTFKR